MKKLTLLAALLITTSSLFAQTIEITPLFGYTFSGKVNGYYGTYDVKDDMLYGGILDVEVDHLLHAVISYRRNDPQLVEKSILGGTDIYDIGVEHYQAGVIRELKDDKVKPFAGVSLGATRYFGKGRNNERYWLFSGAFELGAKVFFNDVIGLRLQSNLTLPMEFGGGGIFCGIGTGGSGCSGSVYFNVPLVHWDLSAGLIIRLRN